MIDALDKTFDELRAALRHEDRLVATHADPFFTFVHDPAQTIELHRRLRRWGSLLEGDGLKVEVRSLCELMWEIVAASGRWEDWLEVKERGKYLNANKSMRDVLQREGGAATPPERAGLMARVRQLLEPKAQKRIVLLTDAALLHPWFRIDKLGPTLHDAPNCPTVLFYPGHRLGLYSLRFLDFYPEDGGSPRTTLLGGP